MTVTLIGRRSRARFVLAMPLLVTGNLFRMAGLAVYGERWSAP